MKRREIRPQMASMCFYGSSQLTLNIWRVLILKIMTNLDMSS